MITSIKSPLSIRPKQIKCVNKIIQQRRKTTKDQTWTLKIDSYKQLRELEMKTIIEKPPWSGQIQGPKIQLIISIINNGPKWTQTQIQTHKNQNQLLDIQTQGQKINLEEQQENQGMIKHEKSKQKKQKEISYSENEGKIILQETIKNFVKKRFIKNQKRQRFKKEVKFRQFSNTSYGINVRIEKNQNEKYSMHVKSQIQEERLQMIRTSAVQCEYTSIRRSQIISNQQT